MRTKATAETGSGNHTSVRDNALDFPERKHGSTHRDELNPWEGHQRWLRRSPSSLEHETRKLKVPKAYVIFTEDIKDPAGMRAYEKASTAAIVEHRAVVLAADGSPQVLEGEWHGQRTVLLEFGSADATRAWYQSDVYQQAIGLRHAAADTNAVIIEGFEMPSRRSAP